MPQLSAIYITHLFNSILDARKFPDILKISKIFRLKKQGKDPLNLASYRPIANLSSVEKLIEEVMKRQLSKFFEDNDVIPPEHHGGRVGHSTMSAKSVVDYNAGKLAETKKAACIITTDLTAAYDTVDHEILVNKLKYHGISESAAVILSEFLKERTYFVEVQGFRSKVMKSIKASVIQGSKLAGILYTIYTLEIPKLPIIMKNPILYQKLTGRNLVTLEEIEHQSTNFVDDSTNTIGANKTSDLEEYSQAFYYLLAAVYKTNKLKLNGEKTNFFNNFRQGKPNFNYNRER